jgi:crossover junction endodeoxyribonuclease RusA
MSARSWSLVIPAPAPWLNANDRGHWRKRNGTIKAWRDAAHIYARQAKLPLLGKAHIVAELRFADRRRRDPHNYFPTVKACVDGLVDYGLLADDSSEFLIGPDIRQSLIVMKRRGELQLTIREAS